jgi:diguanylate cyclase (GGDEF)-like protein
MKIRHKILPQLSLICAFFFILSYFVASIVLVKLLDYAILIFTISTIISASCCILAVRWTLNYAVLHRIEALYKAIPDVAASEQPWPQIVLPGHDELTAIAVKINLQIDMIANLTARRAPPGEPPALQKSVYLAQFNAHLPKSEKALFSYQEHLASLAHYDRLTSLPNRIFFNEMLNKILKSAERHRHQFALLLIDLDNFKSVNLQYGNSNGDRVLAEMAKRLSEQLRAGDILARVDGDQFIILLNNIKQPKFVSQVAKRLLKSCAMPLNFLPDESSPKLCVITASIGICLYPDDAKSLENLALNIDSAVYKAKRSGGNVFHYYTAKMTLAGYEYLQIEAALRKAIREDEFVLYYQPKLNLADGTLCGVEALIRWQKPELGLIEPKEFIPFAEESGLISQIGQWALREACLANKRWQDQGYQPMRIAVNLSPKQFLHEDITELVVKTLAETGLEAHYLELEITETTMMDNLESAISKLKAIKAMGVHIAIDDFGTGYTSISYLKHFPISVLKIDQSFIKGLPDNQEDSAITKAVIALAHNMGLKVVAEGVENAQQLHYLADHNCDMVQGYYLSSPLPEQKFVLQLSKFEPGLG